MTLIEDTEMTEKVHFQRQLYTHTFDEHCMQKTDARDERASAIKLGEEIINHGD